jgi:hypothetical protein
MAQYTGTTLPLPCMLQISLQAETWDIYRSIHTAFNCIREINIDATERFGLKWVVPGTNLDRDTDHLP